jgi:hypothetical protein
MGSAEIDDDLAILSFREIKENGGLGKHALKRAAARGELKIIKLSYNRSVAGVNIANTSTSVRPE